MCVIVCINKQTKKEVQAHRPEFNIYISNCSDNMLHVFFLLLHHMKWFRLGRNSKNVQR